MSVTASGTGMLSDAPDVREGPPDLVLHGGDVLTMSRARPVATALAIRGGAVIAVGDEDLLALRGPGTRIVNVDGRTVLPGIDDSHLHLTAYALFRSVYLDVSDSRASSWEDLARQVGAATPDTSGWVRAWGWDEAALPDRAVGPPDRGLLDAARVSVPAVVFDRTGHQALVNSRALELAGIGPDTIDPPGGLVVRGADGRPTGVLREAAVGLLASALPPLPRSVLRGALLAAQHQLHRMGVTALTEPGLGPGGAALLDGSGTVQALDALIELAAESLLQLRTSVLLLFSGTGGATVAAAQEGLASGLHRRCELAGVDPRWLRILGVKVFADGIPRSGTAWMRSPYPAAGGRGHLTVNGLSDTDRVHELDGIIAAVHAAGLQVGVHAIGDASVAAVIDAVEAAARAHPRHDPRHYVIHGDLTPPDALMRLARGGIGMNANPAIRWAAGALIPAVIGSGRYARHQPLGSAAAAGVHLCLSSDAPVTEPDWRRTVAASVTRSTRQSPGRTDDPERLDMLSALYAHTAAGAWQSFADTWRGRFVPGAAADVCVLDDALPTDASVLPSIPVALTLVNGEIVHDGLGLSP